MQHDKGGGEQLAAQYRQAGVNMMRERATFESGGNSVEAGLLDMLDRMQTGRFKVFAHLNDWWSEMRMYHRKDGQLVKMGEDIISAARMAIMMKRFARTNEAPMSRGRIVQHGVLDSVAGY